MITDKTPTDDDALRDPHLVDMDFHFDFATPQDYEEIFMHFFTEPAGSPVSAWENEDVQS